MGRIRTNQIRVIADKLISKYGLAKFSDSFETNKSLLSELPEELPSITIRNKIAGYLAFLSRKHKAEEAKLLSKSE